MERTNELKALESTLIETMIAMREVDPNALVRVHMALEIVFSSGTEIRVA